MKFSLEVGELEKHLLEYDSDQAFGSLLIKVDDQPIKHEKRLIKPLKETHTLEIGQNERLDVKIETIRTLMMNERNCVYVNGRLVKRYED